MLVLVEDFYIQNGSASITGGNFTGNTVTNDGGAVRLTGASTGDVTFTGVTFDMNETDTGGGDNGGAIDMNLNLYFNSYIFSLYNHK